MTLRDTELIGNKLVKRGFKRSISSHFVYTYITSDLNISVTFRNDYGPYWSVDVIHDIDKHTRVKIYNHNEVFIPEWLVEEHNKLQAIFKFLKS